MSRTKKLATLIGAVFVIVLVVAPIAAAHHPAVTATMDCNGTVSYTVSAWETNDASARTFTGVKVYSGSTLVGTGNFNSADNFSFSGTFTVAAGVNSVVVTAQTDGTWGDGYTGVDQTSDTATRPTNCAKNPTISTVISPSSSITVGAAAHDTSSLTGASAHPTGTVSYKLYSDNHCGTLVADLTPSSNTVTSSTMPDSKPFTFNTAGTFYFVATYSGDSNNTGPVNSGCTAEPLTVGPKAPAVVTVISPAGPIALGTQAHDTSTLTGAFNPTGTVTYRLYSDNHCGTLVADLTPSSNTVTSSTLPDSKAFTFNTAGTFYFVATYSGDSNNTGPVNSGCTAEPLTVGPKAPTVATVISPAGPIALGTQAHDTSTLTGAFNPTGTVTYKLYSDNHCGTLVADLTPSSNTVSSSTLPDSKPSPSTRPAPSTSSRPTAATATTPAPSTAAAPPNRSPSARRPPAPSRRSSRAARRSPSCSPAHRSPTLQRSPARSAASLRPAR